MDVRLTSGVLLSPLMIMRGPGDPEVLWRHVSTSPGHAELSVEVIAREQGTGNRWVVGPQDDLLSGHPGP